LVSACGRIGYEALTTTSGTDGGAPAGVDAHLLGEVIGHWQLDEADGVEVLDSSGRGNHGVVAGAPGPGLRRPGRFGRALFFGAQDAHVSIELRSEVPGVELTISLWAMRLPTVEGITGFLRLRGRSAALTMFLQNASLVAEVRAATSRTTATRELPWPEATWRHVAVTYDGRGLRLFLDGQPLAAAELDGALDFGAPSLIVGTSELPGQGNPFDGAVDEVLLVGRALGADEVATLARLGPCAPLTPQAARSPACAARPGSVRRQSAVRFRNDGEVNSAATARTRSPSLAR
jgi:hypothetical protein